MKVSSPAGEAGIKPRKDTLETKTMISGGTWQKSVWDSCGRIRQYQAHGAKPVHFEYADEEDSFSIEGDAGTILYQIDSQKLIADIVFEDS